MIETVLVVAGAGITIAAIRARARLRRLEHQIRNLRARSLAELAYVPAGDAWRPPELDAFSREAAGLELAILGDVIEVGQRVPLRVFRDAAGTTFGWFALLAVPGRRVPITMVFSHTADDAFSTRRCPPLPSLAQPPFVHRSDAARLASLAMLLDQHRASLPAAPLVAVTTLDDATRELMRMRARVVAWRLAQSPAELLDADLAAILGARHLALAPVLAPRLGVEIPRAQARDTLG